MINSDSGPPARRYDSDGGPAGAAADGGCGSWALLLHHVGVIGCRPAGAYTTLRAAASAP
jgi:hypothetical protein